MAQRLRGRFGYPQDDPFAVTLHPDKLDQPLHWKKPRRVFTVSMGDLFHEKMPWLWIERIFMTMLNLDARHHTFMVLTKRAEHMNEFVSKCFPGLAECAPHIQLGVTVCNAEELWKIGVLLQTPAAKRWVSIEPMLEAMDISAALWGYPEQTSCRTYVTHDMALDAECPEMEGTLYSDDEWEQTMPALDWVVLGGESGPGARPLHPDSVRSIRDQCVSAGVPFLFKQWGAWFPRDQWEHSPELVLPDDDVVYQEARTHIFPDGTAAHRIGKKRAGRLLDGREHNGMPERRR